MCRGGFHFFIYLYPYSLFSFYSGLIPITTSQQVHRQLRDQPRQCLIYLTRVYRFYYRFHSFSSYSINFQKVFDNGIREEISSGAAKNNNDVTHILEKFGQII